MNTLGRFRSGLIIPLKRVQRLVCLGALFLLGASATAAQPTGGPRDTTAAWHDDAWTLMVDQEGVRIHYIYYPEADAEHDGIVLRLINDNDTPVRYAFTLIFRAPDAETTATVRGRLGPGELKTGDDSGLFWVPFKGGDHSLGEIGIRGLDVGPVREPRSAPSRRENEPSDGRLGRSQRSRRLPARRGG